MSRTFSETERIKQRMQFSSCAGSRSITDDEERLNNFEAHSEHYNICLTLLLLCAHVHNRPLTQARRKGDSKNVVNVDPSETNRTSFSFCVFVVGASYRIIPKCKDFAANDRTYFVNETEVRGKAGLRRNEYGVRPVSRAVATYTVRLRFKPTPQGLLRSYKGND
ncbi:uncharacterized protein BT62DRAFT_1003178 [Guyanagaster necrorhizus]|uniref:Uncharacterized protein n=1 Tax=Guyanagaster necrorhizus TaxID=856835 RepID=A0A9P7VXL0_9AGAR|nr:uncharacterized protein BT62DRAFT_1003178 [Guyanagaster necrorhizus MCA 3950]KAG7448463.1 hypothetical protein BT62DRAFT_1003178 [Guyanagaster necrorhizus MCA 3950]